MFINCIRYISLMGSMNPSSVLAGEDSWTVISLFDCFIMLWTYGLMYRNIQLCMTYILDSIICGDSIVVSPLLVGQPLLIRDRS
jgi:hypothetical protein